MNPDDHYRILVLAFGPHASVNFRLPMSEVAILNNASKGADSIWSGQTRTVLSKVLAAQESPYRYCVSANALLTAVLHGLDRAFVQLAGPAAGTGHAAATCHFAILIASDFFERG